MLLLLCESSLSWSVQPSNQFGGHPVFGLTKVYVPIGHSTDAVKDKKVIEEFYSSTITPRFIFFLWLGSQ